MDEMNLCFESFELRVSNFLELGFSQLFAQLFPNAWMKINKRWNEVINVMAERSPNVPAPGRSVAPGETWGRRP